MKPQVGCPTDYVSIIVPTYNSASCLSVCLDSAANQSYPHTELIVVDNYSKDETRNIAATYSAKVLLHKGTQAAARNVGIANSKGKYVLFLDSDQQLDREVVGDCVFLCSACAVEAVKIPEVFLGLNFWGKCSALWKNNMVKVVGRKGGIPRFYKKQLLLDQLAFKSELRWWEDLELYQRLKAANLKEASSRYNVAHYEADSLKNAVRKYLTYGKSVTSFSSEEAKAPYAQTLAITMGTVGAMFMHSGRSISVFMGCMFLVTVKTFSAALGFLSRAT